MYRNEGHASPLSSQAALAVMLEYRTGLNIEILLLFTSIFIQMLLCNSESPALIFFSGTSALSLLSR